MAIPSTMTAMRLKGPGRALERDVVAVPQPSPTEVLLEVLACGACRTDLHVLDGELPDLRYPVTPGHEIVGRGVAFMRGCGASRSAWTWSRQSNCRAMFSHWKTLPRERIKTRSPAARFLAGTSR